MGALVLTLVLSVVCISTGSPTVGGLSDVTKPPFPKNDAFLQLIPQLAKEIRSRAVAGLPVTLPMPPKEAKERLTSPINVVAYKKQPVTAMVYNAKVEIAKNLFVVRVTATNSGKTDVNEVIGPLVEGKPGSSDDSLFGLRFAD